jgi:hypothetical protein
MKSSLIAALWMLGLIVFAYSALAEPEVTPLPENASIDTVLDALDQRGKSMKEFTADVQLTTEDTAIGDSNTRTGKVFFRKVGDKGDAQLNVVLDFQVKKDGTKFIQVASKLQYLLKNGWLYDLDFTKKIRNERQVSKPGDKVNLLKLGEGPFPLPIGQSKEDVHKNFDVTMTPPAKGDPDNTIHLQLKPREGTPLAKRFSKIDVWVDRATNMPGRIDTLDAAGSEQRSTQLTKIVVNPKPPLTDTDFTVPPTAGWNVHVDKFQE